MIRSPGGILISSLVTQKDDPRVALPELQVMSRSSSHAKAKLIPWLAAKGREKISASVRNVTTYSVRDGCWVAMTSMLAPETGLATHNVAATNKRPNPSVLIA
jgi:hypothetical protein